MFNWLRKMLVKPIPSEFWIKLRMRPLTDWVYDNKLNRVKVCAEVNDDNRSSYCLFDDIVDIPYRPDPLWFEIDVPVDCRDISIYAYSHPGEMGEPERINGITDVKAGRYVLHYEFPTCRHR